MKRIQAIARDTVALAAMVLAETVSAGAGAVKVGPGDTLIAAPGPQPIRSSLTVAFIAHHPDPVTAGAAIDIQVQVTNRGAAPSKGTEELHFDCHNRSAGGPPCNLVAGKRTLPVIAAGGGFGVQLLTSPDWKPGSYTFSAWLVVPGQGAGTPKSATITVKAKRLALKAGKVLAGKPDLEFTVSVYGGGTLYPVSVQVTNAGVASSAATTFRLVCDEYKGSAKVGTCLSDINVGVPVLEPGAKANLQMPFAPAMHCDPQHEGLTMCKVTAKVDPGDLVKESDENDNVKVYEIPPS